MIRKDFTFLPDSISFIGAARGAIDFLFKERSWVREYLRKFKARGRGLVIEEFRQPVVDRVVLAHVNLGIPIKMQNGMLEAETKNAFADKVMARLLTPEPYQGKHYQIRSIIQQQARRLASFLRRDAPRYKTFSFKW